MKPRLPFFSPVAALFCICGCLLAQNETVTPEAETEKLQDAVISKLQVVAKTAKEEAAAGRLKEGILSSILSGVEFALEPGAPRSVHDIVFFAKNEHPGVNSNLDKAWDEFNSAVDAWKSFIKRKLPKLMESRLDEAAKAWRNAKTAAELSDVISGLKALRDLAEESFETRLNQLGNALRETGDYLDDYKSFLAALESGDVQVIGREYLSLERQWKPFGGRVSLSELEERQGAPVRKLRAEASALRKQAIDSLPQANNFEQVTTYVRNLERAAVIEEAVTGRYEGKWDHSFQDQLILARDWQRMIELESTGALKEAAELARAMQPQAARSAPALAAVLSRRADSLGRAEWEAAGKKKTAVESDFTTQLVALKDATAALALVGKIRGAAGEALFQSADGRSLAEALSELERIGRVWQAVESQSDVSIAALNQRSPSLHPWRTQLLALADRIQRNHFSVRLKAPELLRPPLSSRPVAEALETLTQEAVKTGDWHRVHELLEAQLSAGGKEAVQEDLAAVRAFIAGENFEKAELFGDAVASYKTVLRSVGRRSPLEPAGNRLKALKVEHPELFQTSNK